MVNTIICCAIGSKSRFTCFYKSWIRQNAPPRIPLRVKIRGTKEYAGVVELVDSVDLGSSAKACRFESCRPHQTNIIRTKSSPWEMGSDYLFSLASSRKPISKTVSSNDQNQSPEGQVKLCVITAGGDSLEDQGGLVLRILLMCQCFRLVFHAVLLDFGHSWMYDPV